MENKSDYCGTPASWRDFKSFTINKTPKQSIFRFLKSMFTEGGAGFCASHCNPSIALAASDATERLGIFSFQRD